MFALYDYGYNQFNTDITYEQGVIYLMYLGVKPNSLVLTDIFKNDRNVSKIRQNSGYTAS